MRPSNLRVAILAAVLGCSVGSVCADPGDGLVNSAHDFSNARTTHDRASSPGLCSACHVPRSPAGARLAWNPAATEDLLADPALALGRTAIAAALKNDTLKGPSVRCISCHDGTVALPDTGAFRHTFAGEGSPGTAFTRPNEMARQGVSVGEHPVPMPYPFRKVASTYNGVSNQPSLMTADFVADPTAGNIRLYSEDGSGTIVSTPRAGKTGIECPSCHDPHNRAVKDRYLLRASMRAAGRSGGYLCMQCHDQH